MNVLERGYGGYLSRAAADVQLEVTLVDGPQADPSAELVVQREGKTWHLLRGDLRAEWNRATGRGRVWQNLNSYSTDVVLRILHTLILAGQDGVLLHAASAKVGDRAFAFSGVSGAGKTTISRLAPNYVTLFTDEISYLKMENGEFRAWGTPFSGELAKPGPNSWARLARVFLLRQGPENSIEPMERHEAVCSVLRNVLFFADDPELAGRVLETVCRLVETVPVQRLTFRPEAAIWDLVTSMENG